MALSCPGWRNMSRPWQCRNHPRHPSHGRSFITTQPRLFQMQEHPLGQSTLPEPSKTEYFFPSPSPASSLPPCLAVYFPTARYQHGIPPSDFCFIR